ncbi:hypothetical protein HMH01_08760 [Halovulum dunhuangense]|uniref:Uncharacterized protein n=1 Tax=Halovulum dunhuangense TaxID=1505036 RepID=A0A849L2R8_9RHOB|nr:hypothetical protein [Halovulum dunhuangense]NNU80530.1 hypothetical protein [Halovulum dunhuangense]
MDPTDIWIEPQGRTTRLCYTCESRFSRLMVYVLAPFLALGLLALVAATIHSSGAVAGVAVLMLALAVLWLVQRFHARRDVHAITFEPAVLVVGDRSIDKRKITGHGRSGLGGDVVVPADGLPRNFTPGPHLFVETDGRQLPITPAMRSDQAIRLHRQFEALYDTWKAAPAE